MSWGDEVAEAQLMLEEMHEGREAALRQCRQLIQLCSRSIKHVHRSQFMEAEDLLRQAFETAASNRQSLATFPELAHAGYVQDAEKELVEAAFVLAAVKSEDLPSRQSLGVCLVAYLNGAGEAASELRRTVLDLMRKGDMAGASRLVAVMETIYDDLGSFDFPDGLTGGLRRTNDALRAVIERTRSDIALTELQNKLHQELVLARESRG